MTRFETERVRRYYERHTRAFVRLGQGGGVGALHRAVWAPGVSTRADAFRYVEDQIAALAPRCADGSPVRIIDLGCGVGGSLCHLATRLPLEGVGITLSPTQAALARDRVARERLSDRISIMEGDYTRAGQALAPAHIVFAIESFVHAADPDAFLERCRELVRSDGVLVMCDDFLREHAGRDADAAIERFRRGWHVNTLITGAELRARAARAGFAHERTSDLTPFLELGRARDRVLDVLAPLVERLASNGRFDPWLGGSALQRCLRHGWIGYDLAVFRAGDRRPA